MAMTNGRAGAVFSRDGDRVTLFASRGIDQEVLDAIHTVWSRYRDGLLKGESFYVSDRAGDRRLPKEQMQRGAAASFAVVPVFEEDALVALLYVDSRDPNFCAEHDLERLGKFSRIVVKAMADAGGRTVPESTSREAWETYLERTPVEDMEREKMLLLLNRNEWNIARVARLMGVTRRTIYLRLQRFNIPREKVRKTRLRPATA